MVRFICYPKCSTCKKAMNWLEENNIAFELRNIKENNPSIDEIKEWHNKSNLPLKKFFNTSGLLYKSLELKDKLPRMNEDEQLTLLASDGMLVKRPILVKDDTVLVGFKESEWAEKLL
ncbi:MAG: arsenate reductase family protein [Clostridia bacterium]|nr:arsenate reductase family protein [Clostridia bacterium]